MVKPAIAAAATGLLVRLGCQLLSGYGFQGWLMIGAGCCITIVIYIVLLFALGCVKKKDLLWLKDCFRSKKGAVSSTEH